MIDAKLEDLILAWERMKSGRPDRVFINHPFLISMVERDLKGWLTIIQGKLKNGYEPSPCVICQVPKPHNLVRPASYLTIEDELVYTYLIGVFYPQIVERIGKHQGVTDIAYQLDKDSSSKNWVKSDFRIWKQWREDSVKKLDEKCNYVVFTDITGYYENIEISILISDIRELCGKSDELNLLSKILNMWAHPRLKGIPQGYFASDVIAKLYLTTIDENLLKEGFNLLRYVDDYRFFVENELRAKQLIKRLAHLIHQRGLNLQSAKTKTYDKEKAKSKIDGISDTIDKIQSELRSEIQQLMGMENVSISSYDLNKLLSKTGDTAPQVLERTFEEFFLGDNENFDKTLFHYLLVRLGKVNSSIAVDYCLQQIEDKPQETLYILRYFTAIGINKEILDSIHSYLNSEKAIYDYQTYLILYWAFKEEINYDGLISISRTLAFDLNKDYWLRSYAIAYLGKYGENGDLELIEQHYPKATTEIEKSDCINSLNRMEVARRNSFYNRVKNQSFLVQKATELNK
jgi:hypothetical protein